MSEKETVYIELNKRISHSKYLSEFSPNISGANLSADTMKNTCVVPKLNKIKKLCNTLEGILEEYICACICINP